MERPRNPFPLDVTSTMPDQILGPAYEPEESNKRSEPLTEKPKETDTGVSEYGQFTDCA